MLSRLIVRLLFRAVLSLGALLGVASYVHYLSGGDPGALWGRVADGAIDGVADRVGALRTRASASVAAPVAAARAPLAGDERRERDDVWTWRDENGVTHYASVPPDGGEATRVSVDPDANVLAPFAAPAADPATAEALLRLLRTPSR